MKKRVLDIIVPHYNESWDIVRPFFDILNSQRGVNFDAFKVWLIHDGTEPFSEDYFCNGLVNVEQICIEHGGVSKARNWGIDHADATWVTFCDCDDCFSSVFSLRFVMQALSAENTDAFDLVWGSFYIYNPSVLLSFNDYNSVFNHNKYYRLDFLKEHNLRFNEKLYMSEDNAFNTIARMELKTERIGEIQSEVPLYIWCRRPGSVTTDFSRWLKNAEGNFDRNVYVLEEYRKHNYQDPNLMVVRTVTDAYSALNKPGFEGDASTLLNRVRDFYLENEIFYHQVPQERLQLALKASDSDAGIKSFEKIQRPSLEEWIEKLTTRNQHGL